MNVLNIPDTLELNEILNNRFNKQVLLNVGAAHLAGSRVRVNHRVGIAILVETFFRTLD